MGAPTLLVLAAAVAVALADLEYYQDIEVPIPKYSDRLRDILTNDEYPSAIYKKYQTTEYKLRGTGGSESSKKSTPEKIMPEILPVPLPYQVRDQAVPKGTIFPGVDFQNNMAPVYDDYEATMVEMPTESDSVYNVEVPKYVEAEFYAEPEIYNKQDAAIPEMIKRMKALLDGNALPQFGKPRGPVDDDGDASVPMKEETTLARYEPPASPSPAPPVTDLALSTGHHDAHDANTNALQRYDLPEFFYFMEPPNEALSDGKVPFAVSPVDSRYYQQVPTRPGFLQIEYLPSEKSMQDLKRAANEDMPLILDEGSIPPIIEVIEAETKSKDDVKVLDGEEQPATGYFSLQTYSDDVENPQDLPDYENAFEEPRQQRQNPNVAPAKVSKVSISPEEPPQVSTNTRSFTNGKFSIERDIPTSLVPTSPRHQHVIQMAMRNNPSYNEDSYVYLYAMIAGIAAAATVALVAFIVGWYTMRKKSKAAVDVEYPAYGVTGPNTDVTPSGDRQLAHCAQMYHYQHQKQQIIAMESHAGMPERRGSLSDAESEEENDEGDYTVYECPGFATTSEMEVKNPMFLDEPTPATPAQPAPAPTVSPKK